jgi:hypothetical protein
VSKAFDPSFYSSWNVRKKRFLPIFNIATERRSSG